MLFIITIILLLYYFHQGNYVFMPQLLVSQSVTRIPQDVIDEYLWIFESDISMGEMGIICNTL